MQSLLKGLNTEQKRAIEHGFGSILVLAGAGSGKTKVLTVRIAHLIKNGVSPYEVLAVTFTNKAAKEMRERLSKVLGGEVVQKMWVGTFHSICGRILRQDIDSYQSPDGKKWDRNFVIYDESDSMTLIKNAIKKAELDDKIYAPKLLKTIISNEKNKMHNAHSYSSKAKDYRSQKIAEVFEEYEKNLQLNNALDFDDMLTMCVNLLLSNEQIRSKYHNRFKHMLVDEFQDTNQCQYQMIKAIYTNNLSENQLENRSLCVVGDVDQSIYSWRGADYKIILNFQNEFKFAKLIKLEQNYRSTENILNVANAIIANNKERIVKNLFSVKNEGEKIDYYSANDEGNEANYVAQKISELKNSLNSFNDFAVLYRTNSQSRAIEEALISKGVPYKIVGGLKFYDRKEIKDIIAYLKLLYNNNDSQALKRVINVPKRAIGATTIAKLQQIADEHAMTMFDVLLSIETFDEISPKTQMKLREFSSLIEKLSNRHDDLSLGEFIALVIEKTGYLDELKEENTIEAQTRIENLQELVNVANEFEPIEADNVFGEFLSQVALVSDLDEVNKEEDETGSVTLMTLHSAKGLEFETVFLIGLEEGLFPHSRSLNSNSEMEEERRLMYVGVTRAQSKLFLTSAKRRQIWGQYQYFNPSRFLSEIPVKFLVSNQSPEQILNGGGEKTFKSAVERIKTDQYGTYGAKSFNSSSQAAYQAGKPAGSNSSSSSSFGKNFVAPKISSSLSSRSLSDVVKPKGSVTSEFNQGDRVFHEKFGMGNILDIENVGSSTMYMIDFGKQGKKAIDADFAKLKKF